MTRTKKWDESSRTRCPGTKWRSRSWTSGPPAPPARIYPPFKFTWLIFYNILKILLGSKKLHIDQWTTSHFQKNETVFCVLARKLPEPLQLLYGTRSSSPTRCRINACVRTSTFGSREYICHQWWPGCHKPQVRTELWVKVKGQSG